ncbi:MAG: hypothetical protein ACRC1W_06340 [Shewanella sp.]
MRVTNHSNQRPLMPIVVNPHTCPECDGRGIFQEQINTLEEPEDCYWCPNCGWAWSYFVQQGKSMTHSYPKAASVSYNATYGDRAVDALAAQYGDFLEGIAIIDKVALLSILSLWQHGDSQCVDDDTFTLLDAANEYSCGVSEELYLVMELIGDLADESSFGLMVAIANQLVAEQK